MKKILSLGLLALLLTGCNKLNRENYDRIESGMTYEQVTKIIGKASQCSDKLGASHCRWEKKPAQISVTFLGGKAAFFSAEGIK
ncbi:MAG: lipoprotein [Aeromonas sp.]